MTMFAKRHYEMIAMLMQELEPKAGEKIRTPHDQHRLTIEVLAGAFAMDNHAFDKQRFIYACQPSCNVKARTDHLKASGKLADALIGLP